MIDPFKQPTDRIKYLQKTDSQLFIAEGSWGNSKQYLMEFRIDTNVQILKRVRYSVWAALGDVGGFHDGLRLVM